MADQEMVLIGVPSDGKTEQWDGLPTPSGILLRWFQGDLGFPGLGYDIYRAVGTDKKGLVWSTLKNDLQGQTCYAYQHDLVLGSALGFKFRDVNGQVNLVLDPQDTITIDFTSPAWFAKIELSPLPNTNVLVSLYANGQVRETRRLTASDPVGQWRTRGIDRIEMSGTGACLGLNYQLISSISNWILMHHACLPVTDPAYAGGSNWMGPDENEAKRRLPAGADWTGRYGPAFSQLYPYLRDIAAGRTPAALPASTAPQAPGLNLSTLDAIQLAALDPHVARMLGLAWDDPLVPNGLDGREYAYKVVGRWPGASHFWELRNRSDVETLADADIRILLKGGAWARTPKLLSLKLGPKGSLIFNFGSPVEKITLVMACLNDLDWEALDASNTVLARGIFRATRKHQPLVIAGPGMRTLRIRGEALIQLKSLEVTDATLERTAIVPGMMARDPGLPAGPSAIQAEAAVASPGMGTIEACLYWDLPVTARGIAPETGSVFYQVAGVQASNDPDQPAPHVPGFDRKYLLAGGDPLAVSPQMNAAAKPRFYTDKPLPEGWRCWWVRGVDLFGRVSAVSAPAMLQLLDQALPPAPPLVLAEYVQGGLLPGQQGMAGYSTQGRAWLEAHPGGQAVVVSWAWTPELAFTWPDVDGFQVQVRRPMIKSPRGPRDPETYYPDDPGSWGPVRAGLGPFAPSAQGRITAVVSGLPDITITQVLPVPVGPEAITTAQGQAVDPALAQSECQTTLSLDAGQAVLLGTVIEANPAPITVVGHGQGTGISITVEHPTGRPPVPGTYTVRANTAKIFSVYTNILPGPLDADPFQSRLAGVLAKDNQRWAVLHMDNGRFLCLGNNNALPSAGDDVTWHPAYLLVIPDNDFGPKPAADKPAAYAQVTVRSVRRWSQRPLTSLPGQPGTLTGVDCTPPVPPILPPPPNIGPFCAQAGTRPDWYGISRFSLNWQAAPGVKYMVYRAMSEAVFELDRKAYVSGMSHPFPDDPNQTWHPDVLSEIVHDPQPRPNRIDIVQDDFIQLHAALDSGDAKSIRAAYRSLHLDAQRLLASQAVTEPAYSARLGEPLDSNQVPYSDEFDGRPRAHWFYRVAARSASGLESPKSAPTPPICCPDVVPPAQPLVLMALAQPGKVRLQWQASPEEDLKAYRIYRAADEAAAADVRNMQEVALLQTADAVQNHANWRQYDDPAPGNQTWYYRIVAEDESGNQSAPSAILSGKALLVAPDPPVWNPPQRTPAANPDKVELSWTHPADQRLACLVERRLTGTLAWTGMSGWLPRGVYAFEDRPPDIAQAWEYRLKVRDHAGQGASEAPVVMLDAV